MVFKCSGYCKGNTHIYNGVSVIDLASVYITGQTKPRIGMMLSVPSLMTPYVAMPTAFSSISDDKVSIMAALKFQCFQQFKMSWPSGVVMHRVAPGQTSHPIWKPTNLSSVGTLPAFIVIYDLYIAKDTEPRAFHVMVVIAAPHYTGNETGHRAPSQYKDRLIYVWRFPC